MDSYNLHIKSTQQQFEAELRDTVQALPIPNKNTWFGVEASNLFRPDVVSILMVVWHPGEWQEIPKVMLGTETDTEGNPLAEPHLQRVGVEPQTRKEQVPSAIRCRCFQHGSEDLRVNIKCVDKRASPFCGLLVKELGRRFAPNPGITLSRPRSAPKGAPRLTERDDWPEKLQMVAEWEARVEKGVKPEIAAELIGRPLRTLQRWRAVRDASSDRK